MTKWISPSSLSPKLFIGLMIVLNSAMALECPESYKATDVAIELLRSDFSGLRLESHQNHKCLNQTNFPFTIIESDFSNDEVQNIFGFLRNMDDLSILSLKKINAAAHTYKVKFQVKHNTSKNRTFYNVKKDSFKFFLYTDKKNQSIYGCGGIIEAPKNIFLLQSCQ
jgi:hypothetical protein